VANSAYTVGAVSARLWLHGIESIHLITHCSLIFQALFEIAGEARRGRASWLGIRDQ